MKAKLDLVSEEKETLIVHRAGQEDVVMIPLSEFNSWTETNYLLSTENNRKHLARSIKEMHSGKTKKMKVGDLWK